VVLDRDLLVGEERVAGRRRRLPPRRDRGIRVDAAYDAREEEKKRRREEEKKRRREEEKKRRREEEKKRRREEEKKNGGASASFHPPRRDRLPPRAIEAPF
jgi:hypothetical protein